MPKKAVKGYAKKKFASKDKKQDKRISKIEKHISSTELKQLTTNVAQTGGVVLGSGRILTAAAQGDDIMNRQGDLIKPIKLAIKWFFQNSDPLFYYQARGMLIRVNNTGSTMSLATVLDAGGGPFTQAPLNIKYTRMSTKDKFITTGKEYEVLYDTGLIILSPSLLADPNAAPYLPLGTAGANGHGNCKTINKQFFVSARKPCHFVGPLAANLGQSHYAWLTFVSNVAVLEGGTYCSYFTDPS